MTQEELINGVKSTLPNGTYSEREIHLAFLMFKNGYQYALSSIKGEIERDFYKLNLDYLSKKQVEEVEEMVRTWNKEPKTSNENIKNCVEMCLTDANEQRFEDFGTTLKDCLAWLEQDLSGHVPFDTEHDSYEKNW